MTKEELPRAIGVSHGMCHALVALRIEIGRMTYDPIHPRHTRKIRNREMQVAPLRRIYAKIDGDLRRLQAVILEASL